MTEASDLMNRLQAEADKSVGISSTPVPGVAAGEGLNAALKDLSPSIRQRLGETLNSLRPGVENLLSKRPAFGGNVLDFIGERKTDLWNHKTEILAGALASGITKATVRTMLTGSGAGIATVAAIGAAGGAASGAAKEYFKQRKDISITEAGNKLVIDGLRNEWRRVGEADKAKIGKAAMKGAIFGAGGAIIGAEIADHWDFIQEKLYETGDWVRGNVKLPEFTLPSSGSDHMDGVGASLDASPTPTITATKNPIQIVTQTRTPSPTPFPSATPTPAEVTPTPIPRPEATPTPIRPSIVVPDQQPAPVTPDTLRVVPPIPGGEAVLSPDEIIKVPRGSNVWTEVKNYMEQNSGKTFTNTEIANAVKQVSMDSHLPNPNLVMPGTELNMHSLNEVIGKPSIPVIEISPELAKLPDVIALPAGSNPWDEVSKYGASYLGRDLTNVEKLLVTKELCKQSGISVPTWGLTDGINQNRLGSGFKLLFNDKVKIILEGIKSGVPADKTLSNISEFRPRASTIVDNLRRAA